MEGQTISISQAAVARIKHLAHENQQAAPSLRIGVRRAGCSGMAYTIDLADDRLPLDAVVESDGVTVLIDPEAAMYLAGAELDFVEEKLSAGFVFNNPNEKGRCGCGESFFV
ncbi:MAG: iron-sulfur cluster assembly accessory protein [Alphaproteobacteria bacterium]